MSPDEARRLVESYGSINAAAKATGIGRTKLQTLVKLARTDTFKDELPPVEDLIAERKRKFTHKRKLVKDREVITLPIKEKKPIGIIHFGDPHVDDDGTDIEALERHTQLVRDIDGLYAANLGDTTNCWTGRLARL